MAPGHHHRTGQASRRRTPRCSRCTPGYRSPTMGLDRLFLTVRPEAVYGPARAVAPRHPSETRGSSMQSAASRAPTRAVPVDGSAAVARPTLRQLATHPDALLSLGLFGLALLPRI